MKPSVLSLACASVALGASSLYFWQQLRVERERAAQVQQTSRQLEARIAELERARNLFAGQHPAGTNPAGPGAAGEGAAAEKSPVSAGGAAPKSEPGTVWSMVQAPGQSEAFQKVMRSQLRAGNRRLYADIGEELGLSKETTAQLIDLVTEHQTLAMDEAQNFTSAEEMRSRYQEIERQNDAAIAELLGPEKARAYQQYRESLPARSDFEAIEQQFNGNDQDLSPDQRKKLLAIYVEERGRVPMPQLEVTAGQNPDGIEYTRKLHAWMDDYTDRVTQASQGILNTGQRETYDQYQQWQRELRSQFANMSFSPVSVAPGTVALPAGNMTVGAASGVAIAGPTSNATRTVAPRDDAKSGR